MTSTDKAPKDIVASGLNLYVNSRSGGSMTETETLINMHKHIKKED